MKTIDSYITEKLHIGKNVKPVNADEDIFKKIVICLSDHDDYEELSWDEVKMKFAANMRNAIVDWVKKYDVVDIESYTNKPLTGRNDEIVTSKYTTVDADFIEKFVKENIRKTKDIVIDSPIVKMYANNELLYTVYSVMGYVHLIIKK